ncbi:MAG: chemotaxis protein CheX [Bryobacteraceae bacterium]|nr:chemotaxis protein CheX [Bryobacteraceae bacterium]
MLEPATRIDEQLGSVTRAVLETMFFTEPGGLTTEDSDLALPRLAVMLRFRGSPSGDLSLSVTRAAMAPLAAAFLGEDEVSPTQVDEMACELANMLCGSLVSRLETRMSFDLSSPTLITPEAALAPRAGEVSRQSCELAHGTLTVVLSLDADG